MSHEPDSATKRERRRSCIRPRGFREGYKLVAGTGRTEVWLKVHWLGPDLVVHIGNGNAHVGAVALAEYEEEHRRASVSVLTRSGHKEEIVAREAARRLAGSLRSPVCVLAGIHLPDASRNEIARLVRNAGSAVTSLIRSLKAGAVYGNAEN